MANNNHLPTRLTLETENEIEISGGGTARQRAFDRGCLRGGNRHDRSFQHQHRRPQGRPVAFDAIAHKSDFTAEKVAFFLLDPHPKMPNFPLSRNEAADLAAYIGSLRK
jgi:hypothetical protein